MTIVCGTDLSDNATATVTATSKEHLETMYQALGKLELVRVVL